jgi:outer membrane protein OmpA-like peptidoglycan-associated protein
MHLLCSSTALLLVLASTAKGATGTAATTTTTGRGDATAAGTTAAGTTAAGTTAAGTAAAGTTAAGTAAAVEGRTDAGAATTTEGASDAATGAAAGTTDAPPATPAAADRGPEPSSTKWVHRFPPRKNEVQLGVYGGALLPSRHHELYEEDPSRPNGGYDDLAVAAGMLGARVSYGPLRWLALEAEGGMAPTRTASDARATVWHARGSIVGQIGRWSAVPFVLLGAGALGVASNDTGLGNDTDAAIHFGGGLKIHANDRMAVRLDLRDVVAARRGADDGVTHSGEILLGASVRLGRRPPEPPPPAPGDRDADGIVDPVDACPDRFGPAPSGCPIPDTDGDGWRDPDDHCPDVPGIEPHGCPLLDRDRDGFLDEVDACVEEPGVAPDGCPLRDRDSDGILDIDDKCPDEPETRNSFEDADGCPDELPAEVKAFTGVIKGIYFDLDKATIRPRSRAVLDRAVDVLSRYPSIRVEISGHTDSTGSYAHNVLLSERRAISVKNYMTSRGIDGSRIETRGAGPDEPIADNGTRGGRDTNRRIEFRILMPDALVSDQPGSTAPVAATTE